MLCHRIFKHSISIFLIYLLFVLLFADPVSSRRVAKKLIVVSVATDITDGFLRFNRSLNIYGLQLEILGLHTPWNGGDVARHAGGGQKILLFQHYLESVRNEEELLILFTDSYDVIFTDGAQEIIRRFEGFNANVIFSSEKSCWPDHSLASKYPKEDNNRYLNSGGIIGFAPELYALTNLAKIKDNDDDQLFFTKIYLDQQHREKFKIKLDRNNFIFQCLYGEVGEIEIRFTEAPLIDKTNADSHAFNKATQTRPIVVHGNGLSKPAINSLGNYLAKSWHPAVGCMACEENRINLGTLKHEDYPHVLIAINIFQPTPFFPEFLDYITSLDYYKDKITLFIQSKTDYHSNQITELLENFKSFYRNTKYIEDQEQEEWQIRNAYVDECTRVKCDYLFVVDSEARITNPRTLRNLIEANRSIIAPMLVRPKEYWSNFWGAITEDGFYSRSFDYVAIIKNERRGIWNVPYISTAYLIKSRPLFNKEYSLSTQKYLPFSYRFNHSLNNEDPDDNSLKTLDPDMYMCAILRSGGVFMFVDNLEDHGHLAQMDTMDIKLKHPEFYEIYSNEIDWRKRYIHENYTNNLLESTIIEQPCPDVYWFPVVTPAFCRHLIEIMENFGEWSAGKNQDPRLSGGYENVPTRDIHMNQVGLDQHWLYFLREYIRPVQEKIFIGYYHDPPKALMNFVVRYHPQEQAFLRPHHDASTYTINIALNRPKIDYEGGGCRFLRYNCSLLDLRVGWSLIHPGRLTHYHEGLTVTKGVRYIMVSFVDP